MIGFPKTFRSFEYLFACSRHLAAIPRQTVAMPTLPYSRVCIAWMKPLPTLPRTALVRHFAVLQDQFGRGRAAEAHLVEGFARRKSLSSFIHQKTRYACSRSLRFVVIGKDQRRIGYRRVGDKCFGPVENPLVSLFDSRCLDGSRIRAGFRFGKTETADDFTLDDPRKIFFLLLFRCRRA